MGKIENIIKTRREELGITQEELAARLGYKTRSTIARIESGENSIPLKMLGEYSKALDIPLWQLLDMDPELSKNDENYHNQKLIEIQDKIKAEATKEYQIQRALQIQQSLINEGLLQKTDDSFLKIREYLNLLNNKGKEKAIENIELLTKIPEFQKDYSD